MISSGSYWQISANSIQAQTNEFFGPIFGETLQGALISNNVITGSGPVGMGFGFACPSSASVNLVGNNVQNWEPTVLPAPIWLGPGTSNSTVVGGAAHKTVFDQGINNHMTGVNNMQGNPPGPAIRDAMQRKREVWQNMTWD